MNTPWLDALLKACEQLQFVDLDIRERVLVKAKQEVCAMKMRLEQSIPPASPDKEQVPVCFNCGSQTAVSKTTWGDWCCVKCWMELEHGRPGPTKEQAQEKPRDGSCVYCHQHEKDHWGNKQYCERFPSCNKTVFTSRPATPAEAQVRTCDTCGFDKNKQPPYPLPDPCINCASLGYRNWRPTPAVAQEKPCEHKDWDISKRPCPICATVAQEKPREDA